MDSLTLKKHYNNSYYYYIGEYGRGIFFFLNLLTPWLVATRDGHTPDFAENERSENLD